MWICAHVCKYTCMLITISIYYKEKSQFKKNGSSKAGRMAQPLNARLTTTKINLQKKYLIVQSITGTY